MSEITDFLSGLTIEQLEFAKSEAIGLIAKKQAAKKHVVWRVKDPFKALRNFTQNDYMKAAKFLIREAEARQQTTEYVKQLSLEFILVEDDDLHIYLSAEEVKTCLQNNL